MPRKSSGYSFIVSDEEETGDGEPVGLEIDLVTGGVGRGLGGPIGEVGGVWVVAVDVIGAGS